LVALAVENLVAALGAGPHAGRPPNPINADALLARGPRSA
jgi:gluconate 2-dehydrogenase